MQCPQRPEENMGSPGAAVADNSRPSPLGCWEPNLVLCKCSTYSQSAPTQSASDPEFSSLRFCCMHCDCQVGTLAFAGHFVFALLTC